MEIERRRAFIINFVYYCIIGLILFALFRYGIFWLLPFIIGFGVAFILKPLINFLSAKLHLSRKLTAGLTVLLFYATAGVLLSLLGVRLFLSLKEIFFRMPYIYNKNIEPALLLLFDDIEQRISLLDPALVANLEEYAQQFIRSIGSMVSQLSVRTVGTISAIAASVPGFLIEALFSVISSFFIAMDYYKLTGFIARQLPDKGKMMLFDIKDYVVGTLFKYIKSYSIIMGITFLELSAGLWLIGVEKAVAIALLIAIFDVLPVLGTGGIMVPWTIIELLKGDYFMAMKLLIIYLVVTIVRNILEPKVIGTQVGLHPVVTLMSMFVGVRLFGFLGLFILPIIIVILKNLNDNGKLKLFK